MWTFSTIETIAFIALVAGMAALALWAPRGPLRAGLAMKEVAEISAINRLRASVVRLELEIRQLGKRGAVRASLNQHMSHRKGPSPE